MTTDNKHLLITYSWSVNNIGDIGITPGLLNLIAREKKSLPVKVFAWQPEDDPGYAMVKDYLPRYKQHCEVLPMPFLERVGPESKKGGAWQRFAGRWGASALEGFRRGCLSSYESREIVEDILEHFSADLFSDLKKESPDTAHAFSHAGFVLYNSGTTLNFGRLGVRNLWGYTLPLAMPLIIARKLGIPYGVNSQSFDTLEWPMDLLYRTLFADARFLYCRDSDSLNYLHQRGLTNRSSGYRPDSTFFFQGFDEPWADAFTQTHDLREKEFLCVLVRISETQAILDDPTGGTVSRERQQDHMRKTAALIEAWVKQTGGKVLICHETRHTLDTVPRYLLPELPEDILGRVVYMDSFWTTEQAYSVFKRARLVVSMEMHSIIMAINVGTPIIHNPFDECGRKKWMIRDLGLGDCLLDLDRCPADALAMAALNIHRDYATAARRIAALRAPLEIRARATLQEVWSHWAAEPDAGAARTRAMMRSGRRPGTRPSKKLGD